MLVIIHHFLFFAIKGEKRKNFFDKYVTFFEVYSLSFRRSEMRILIASNKIEYIKKFSNYIALNYELAYCSILISDKKDEIISLIKDYKVDFLIAESRFITEEIIHMIPIVIIDKKKSLLLTENDDFYYAGINDSEDSITSIKKIIQNYCYKKSFRELILDQLLDLGFSIKHKGTQYLLEIMMHIKFSKGFFNMGSNVNNEYLYVAKKHNITKDSVKSNIINSINYMYAEAEFSKLKDFFSLIEDCKPSPKLVILTLSQKI